MKGSGGRPVEVVDLDEQMEKFDKQLQRPLNYERMREALMEEVAQ